jgi:branched-chain amino acid transport system substrate-binding protein
MTFLLLALLASQAVTGDAVLIGMEGPAQSFPVDEENLGMRLVLMDVNASGGVHGRKLVERSYPRGTEEPVADGVRNARTLVEKDGVFLLFNFGGPASVEIASYAMDKRVPYLFPHTALVTLDGARYVFTSFPRFEGESLVMLRYLFETRRHQRIAVIHDPNAYGSYFRDRTRELAPEIGYRFVGSEAIATRDPDSALEEMTALQKDEPDAVIMALYPAQARRVMEAKAALGWRDVTMVSSGPLTDEQYLNVPGGSSEGTLGYCHFAEPGTAEGPGFDAYRALMKRYFPGRPYNRYSLYGYVFGKLVVEGLRRAGRSLDREAFLDAMESIRDWDSGGILPKVSFSRENHHAQRAGFVCELEDGEFRRRSDWVEPREGAR